MLDLNTTARCHFVARRGNDLIVTPRASTWNARRSFDSLRGAVVFSMLLLNCSPSYVEKWQRQLETWTGFPVDVLGARRSLAYRHKVDAVLAVNPCAGQWTVIQDALKGRKQTARLG